MEKNDDFKLSIKNRLVTSAGHVAQEMIADNKDNRKWIAIYPYTKKGYLYKVFFIELPKFLLEEELDWSEEMEISKEFFFKTENELLIFLNENNIELNKFDYPWKVSYPYD